MSTLSQQKPSSGADQQESQQPKIERLQDGSAHFEFSGEEHAAETVKTKLKADTDATAWVHHAKIVGKAVESQFQGERAADVRFQHAEIEAKEEDLVMYIKGGKSKWIIGQTKEVVETMRRGALLGLWEGYVKSGRNSSINHLTRNVIDEDYPKGDEVALRKFIIGFLAVSNGESAD